jgi:hypothetical protein
MPQALAAIGTKTINRALLKRFGHRNVLVVNTVLLGITITLFQHVSRGSSVWEILPLSFAQGFFSSIQFTSMNSLAYADVEDRDASKASSIASTAQQMSLSFGVAAASLATALFIPAPARGSSAGSFGLIHGVHHAFLVLGGFTVLSALLFRGLTRDDGASVSHYKAEIPQE